MLLDPSVLASNLLEPSQIMQNPCKIQVFSRATSFHQRSFVKVLLMSAAFGDISRRDLLKRVAIGVKC